MFKVKNDRIYYRDLLVGFMINELHTFLDASRLPKFESLLRWHNIWYYKIVPRLEKMEYLGALDLADRTIIGSRYKPVFRDENIAVIENVVIPASELDLVTNPMFLDNSFLLFPKFMIIEVGKESNALYPTVFRIRYPSNIFGKWNTYGRLKGEDMILVSRGTEYLIVDTNIEVLNLFKDISPLEVKLSIGWNSKLNFVRRK